MSSYTGHPDFFLMGIHTKPSDVEGELNFLDDAYNEVARAFNTTNAFILGDFNADCSYLSKANYNKLDLVSDPRFTWLLETCLLYTSPSPRDATLSRMPSSA